MPDDKNPIAKNLPDAETSENLPPLIGPFDLPSSWLPERLRELQKQLTSPTSLSRARKNIDRAIAVTRVIVVESAPAKSAPAKDARDTWDTKIGQGGGGVQQAPTKPAKKNWYKDPLKAELEAVMKDIAQPYPPGARPGEDVIWAVLKARPGWEDLPRSVARWALKEYAPQLLGRPGHHSTKSPS
jgi:hypothetical protein